MPLVDDDARSLCSSNEDAPPSVNSRFARCWSTIPPNLTVLQEVFAGEIHQDPLMQIPVDKSLSMDGVCKCFKSVPVGSSSLLHQEPDGITWAICQSCVAQIPLEIQRALYFFHSLSCHVQDYAMFAVASENVLLKHERKKGKTVRKLLWSRHERVSVCFYFLILVFF